MPVPKSMPFAEFRAELDQLYRVTRAKKTAQKMRQVLTTFAALPGVATTADLDVGGVAAFLEALADRHPNTRFTLASYLRRACNYAVGRGYAAISPFAAWPEWTQAVEPTPPAAHPLASIRRVLDHLAARAGDFAGGRLHALAATLSMTGLRRDEALFLQPRDVDLPGRTIRVVLRRRLKRPTAARSVPVGDELAGVLEGWMPRAGASWVFPGVRGKGAWHGGAPGYRPTDRLAAAAEAAGVPGFTPASLRHSFATLCATVWNVPPAALQVIMGHTDLKTTMRYYVHIDQAHLADVARRFRLDAA